MIKYYLKNNNNIIIQVKENIISGVPTNPANTDYQAYLAWVAEGNEAEEWSAE
jgi:hypothetical protein